MKRSAVAWFEARFSAIADRNRAVGQKAYMKSDLAFFGVVAAQLKTAVRDFLKEEPPNRTRLLEIAAELYEPPSFDLHSAAVLILDKRAKLLEAEDLPFLIDLIRRSSNWAHGDELATHVIPPPLYLHPKWQG